jgi:hypothetical protein
MTNYSPVSIFYLIIISGTNLFCGDGRNKDNYKEKDDHHCVINVYKNVELIKSPLMFRSFRTIFRGSFNQRRLFVCTFQMISKKLKCIIYTSE